MSSDSGFEIVASTMDADFGFLQVERVTVLTPKGETIDRVVVRHPGAVAVVPLHGENVVLIAQYRAPIDAVVLEIPAGKLDVPGEDRRDAAHRELAEETGYVADDLVHLTDLQTAVGFSDECISIYLAPSTTPGSAQPAGAEEVAAQVITMPLSDAVEAVTRGDISDAKTVAGILLTERLRGTS